MDYENLNKERYRRHYSDDGFWAKLRKAAVRAGAAVVYPALLLYYVLKSDSVPAKMKLYIIGALGYLILPMDLLPDAIPLLGYSDDLAALVAVYNLVKSSITPEIRAKAHDEAARWFGLSDISRAASDLDPDSGPDEQ